MEAAADQQEGIASASQQGGGPGSSGASSGTPATFWPPSWRMRWSGQQSGLLRFNCADSLDRTNAATCFAMLPVLQEQLRMLGVVLECNSAPAAAALVRSRLRSSAGDVAALAQQAQQADPLEAVARALPEVGRCRHGRDYLAGKAEHRMPYAMRNQEGGGFSYSMACMACSSADSAIVAFLLWLGRD